MAGLSVISTSTVSVTVMTRLPTIRPTSTVPPTNPFAWNTPSLPTDPSAGLLVVQVPVIGIPLAVAASCTSFGWPLTSMSDPPAAVISPPATDGGPPSSPTKLRTLPSPVLLGMMSAPPAPPSSTGPGLSPPTPKPEPPDLAHPGLAAPSARVRGRARGRVDHRIANPSRTEGATHLSERLRTTRRSKCDGKLGILTRFTAATSHDVATHSPEAITPKAENQRWAGAFGKPVHVLH